VVIVRAWRPTCPQACSPPASRPCSAATLPRCEWSFVGDGAVAEDVANLIADSVADALIDPALLPEIDREITAAYVAGLRTSGWRGGDAVVRRAIQVTGAAKYCWLAPIMLLRLAEDGPRAYDRRGPEEVLRGRAGMLALVAGWAAKSLAG
jgi:hypothetical protein